MFSPFVCLSGYRSLSTIPHVVDGGYSLWLLKESVIEEWISFNSSGAHGSEFEWFTAADTEGKSSIIAVH
jgi:hypothetical protein